MYLDIYTMCGIAGILSADPSGISPERLKRMTDAIAHRGPDGEGFYFSPSGQLGLGHRRLSIIDTSELAGQPMHYLDRYTLIHNGEIYNYIELKEQLQAKGYRFSTRSDTEVILAAYDLYQADCLQHFDGMFAFALWDRQEQVLFCARDRFGEKPFYYTWSEDRFCFASERKALWAGGQEKKVNQPLLLNYLALGLTETAADSTITFHQDIFSLPPSHYIKIHLPSFSISMARYYDGDKQQRSPIGERQAAEQFRELLLRSTQKRLRSDVPLGCSLSGGLDSSSIVWAISQQATFPGHLQTYSAVFPGFAKDESAFAGMINEQFRCNGHAVTPTAEDFIGDFEKLCHHQEEPFPSSSIYAQYKVFEAAARNGTKVLLDGQGADEILGGYARYIPWYLQEILRTKKGGFRSELKAFRNQAVPFSWNWKNYLAAYFPLQVPGMLRRREAAKINRQPDVTAAFRKAYYDEQSIYKPLVMKLNDLLYFDTYQFGLEQLLRVADRNSMAHGREIRLPFLNHELVEFAGAIPSGYKLHAGWTKWILRKSTEGLLPGEIVWRKDKTGFEPPQQQWMGKKLLQDYLFEAKKKLVAEKILRPEVLNKKNQPMEAHAADNYDWRYLVAAAFI